MSAPVDYGSFHETDEQRALAGSSSEGSSNTTPKNTGHWNGGGNENGPNAAKRPANRRFPWSASAVSPPTRTYHHDRGNSVSCPILPKDDCPPSDFRRTVFAEEPEMELTGSCRSSATDVLLQQPLITNSLPPLSPSGPPPRSSGVAVPVNGAGDAPSDGSLVRRPIVTSMESSRSFFTATSATTKSEGGGGSGAHPGRGDFTVVDINSPTDSEGVDLPKERLKTLAALLFFGLCALVNMITLAIIHDQVPPREKGALPDIVLDHIYTNDWALNVSEYLLMALTYTCVLLCFFHVHRWIVFRRCFFLLGLLYLYRSVTMFVTVLPVASPTYMCNPQSNHTTVLTILKRTGELMLGMGLSVNGYHRYCGDYIYSGHTMILVMGALVVREYTPRVWWPLHWLTYFWSAAGIFMLLFSRGHYTVDVVIAYYITTRLFWIYHTLAHSIFPMKLDADANPLGRSWWYPFFCWMEINVAGPLPHVFQSPIPFAKFWRWFRRKIRRE